MTRYLLDTNVIIYYLRDAGSPIAARLKSTPVTDLSVCSVVKAELFFGSAKSAHPTKSRAVQAAFLAHLVSYPFDDKAADCYAHIRSVLEKSGQPIGANDLLIASIALANHQILVSANQREFLRVPDLQTEDWLLEL